MKIKFITLAALAVAAINACAAVTVSDVKVFSGYPWQEVVIGYKITGSPESNYWITGIEVTARDNVSGKTFQCKTLTDASTAQGIHVMKWNAVADGVRLRSNNVVFTIRIVTYSDGYGYPHWN